MNSKDNFIQRISEKNDNKFDINKLFKKDIKKEIEMTIESEIKILENNFDNEIVNKIKNVNDEKKKKDNLLSLNLKTKLSTTNLAITELKQTQEFYDNIIFIKIINDLNLIFIASSSKELLIYNIIKKTFYIEKFEKDYITCMDYEPKNDVFIFGHVFGKLSFAHMQDGKLQFLKKKLEGYSTSAIKKVTFIFEIDLIIFTNVEDFTEILYKFGKKSLKYQIKHLLTSTKGKKYKLGSFSKIKTKPDEKTKKFISLLLAFTSQVDVIFIKINLSFENENLKTLGKLSLIKKISKKSENGFSNGLQEKKKKYNFEIKAFFDNKQWLIQCQDYVIIIWEDKIEQYFITPDLKFINSFSINTNKLIIGAFLCSTELLYILDFEYNIFSLNLSKLRYSLDTIKDSSSYIKKLQKSFSVSKNSKIYIGDDISKKMICVFDNLNLEYFEILDWQVYLEQAIKRRYFRESLAFLIDLGKGIPWKLNGVMYPLYNCSTNTNEKNQKKILFFEEIGTEAEKLIKELDEYFKKESLTIELMDLTIEVLVLTNNFQFLSLQFINTITNNHLNHPAVIKKFLEQIFLFINEKIINQYFNSYLFIKIMELFNNEKNIEIVQKFLFYVLTNFNIKDDIINLIKIMCSTKNLGLFSFYFLLKNPSNIENIKEFFGSQNHKIDNLIRSYSYIFDIYNQKKFLKIVNPLNFEINTSSKEMTKIIFLEYFDTYLKRFPLKSIYIILDICEEYNFIENGKNEILANFDPNYNNLFYRLLNSEKLDSSYLLLILIFRLNFEKHNFNENFLNKFLLSILEEKNLKQYEILINYDYLLICIYNFFYLDRNFFINSEQLKNFLEKNKTKNNIYKILHNDINGNLLQNFEIYLQTNCLFEIMSRKLQNNDNKKQFINLLKTKYKKILAKDQKKFIELVLLLPIIDIIEIINLLNKCPKTQYKLLLEIENINSGEYINGQIGIKYFELISIYNTEKVINFLENKRYDVDKIINICEKTNNQRGYGYLKYKMGKNMVALKIYLDYIKVVWEDGDENLVNELIRDVLSFKLEILDFKEMILKSMIFISNLNNKNLLKKKIIDLLMKKMISLDFKNIVDEIKDTNKYYFFLENIYLASSLFLNLKIIVDFMGSKDQIFLGKNIEDKIFFIKNYQKGISTIYRECAICKKVANIKERFNGVVFHSCKNMFHLNCLNKKIQEMKYCPVCDKRKNLKIKKPELKESVQELYRRRRKSTARFGNKKISFLDEFSKLSSGNLFFEQEEFHRMKKIRAEFDILDDHKRGLGYLNVIDFYFDV